MVSKKENEEVNGVPFEIEYYGDIISEMAGEPGASFERTAERLKKEMV